VELRLVAETQQFREPVNVDRGFEAARPQLSETRMNELIQKFGRVATVRP
jgi:hypothetical protein